MPLLSKQYLLTKPKHLNITKLVRGIQKIVALTISEDVFSLIDFILDILC